MHLADCHLGLVTHSRTDPTTGLPSRLLDVAKSWKRAVEIGVDHAVDAIVVAGDTFHSRNPDAASLNLFADGLRAAGDIPVLIIDGNHDANGENSVIRLFHDPPNVYAVTRPEVVEIEGIRFGCVPWVGRKRLMASRPGITRAEADNAVVDALIRIIADMRSQDVDVLVGHWSVQGSVLGAEQDVSALVQEPVIPLADMEGPWGYAAWGHIHKRQDLSAGDTLVAYSGSIERVSFSEENEPKVALEVDLEPSDPAGEVEEIQLPARRFVTLGEVVPGLSREVDLEGAIVRVKNTLSPEEAASFDHSKLERELYELGAHQVLIQTQVQREVHARAEKVTEELGPADALEEWMQAEKVTEEERPALRDAAKQLMEDGS